MIKAKLDHKKVICEIEARGKIAEITNEVANIIENIYATLDEPYKTLYKHALITAIKEGQLLE